MNGGKRRRILPVIGERTHQIHADIVTLAFNNYNMRFHAFTVDARTERLLATATGDVELEPEVILFFNPEVFASTIVVMLDTLKNYLHSKDLEFDEPMKNTLRQLKSKIEELLEEK